MVGVSRSLLPPLVTEFHVWGLFLVEITQVLVQRDRPKSSF